ncbi:hypothetical protein Mal15_24540 [Stieleria maiorica]|uniref:DUF423 domain-containing protein n=1 Tax=Stieleria maiorica TaxID=2795974 RepID=A0A5B9MB56_9BACT|nr:DUF423 domain-containing protein [Stieleria maiorica]QEF98402.1 hypothetical protein Mal15_24540 [Stieleria maiorica]
MNSPDRFLLVAAAIAGATGVALGAFAAHGLEGFLQSQGLEPEMVAKRVGQFETGSRYHLVHAVVLLALSGLAGHGGSMIRRVGALFLAGIVLFSGSLYVLVLTGTPWLGAITPLGGVAWIIAWVLLGFWAPRRQAV